MKKRILIGLAVVVVVGGLGIGIYARLRPARAAGTSTLATATVQRETLQATVNAAGNIQAHQQVDLAFGQTGTVKKINFQVGDRVRAGDVLGEIDTAALALQLRTAQVSLKNAQDQLAQTKNPNTQQDIASARAQLDSAQAAYDKLAAGPTPGDLVAAQAQVASAQAGYDAAVKSANATNSQLASASATLEKARIALQTAQADYDRVSWRADVAQTSQAATLQSATIDYNSAKAAYEAQAATNDTNTASSVAQARSSLDQARASLAKLQPTAADLASAQSTLTQAKNSLDKLLAGPDANALDIAQNNVEQAQIGVDQARLTLQEAQVLAPFDGVVTQVNVKMEQSAGASAAFQLADLDHLEIVVNMAEVDVNRIKVGQAAQITLDALPDATLSGKVSLISPAGTMTQGVVNYPVTIALDSAEDGVKPGMTANLNVVVNQRENVLTVPNRAVRTSGRQKTVTVLFEGQQIAVPVQTGLSSDTSTEITSGLKEGDVVLLTSTTTAQSQTRVGGMGFGAFGGPGR